jgi:REP element-mobilizing transposase RayT
MARPLRIEYSGAIYHITSRGNARLAIYEDDEDRRFFIKILGDVIDRYNWICYAYCLMDNHYHLLIETPDGNLSQGMRQLNGVYTQKFNWHHGRVGHIFQGRFKAILVDRDNYLLELCRYLVLNPVRAGIATIPEAYPWSSYRAIAGLDRGPSFLNRDWILAQFGKRRRRAERNYRDFVKAASDMVSPWSKVQGQIFLGSAKFVEEMRPLLEGKEALQEVPKVQRFAHRPELKTALSLKSRGDKEERNKAIRSAHFKYGYPLKEIGRHLGLHYTTISKIINCNE